MQRSRKRYNILIRKKLIRCSFATDRVIRCINRNCLADFNEVIMTDHCRFLFDLDAYKYFKLDESKYNQITTRLLNSNNRVHKNKFKEKLQRYLKETKLYKKVQRICTSRVTSTEINVLDNKITYVLNTTRKYVEGIKINILFSKEK